MAAIEGENASTPDAQNGYNATLLLPVLSGEGSTATAGSSGATTTPRVSLDNRSGIARRSTE
jgi:hypothetical protein